MITKAQVSHLIVWLTRETVLPPHLHDQVMELAVSWEAERDVVEAALEYVRADIEEVDDMPHWRRLQDACAALSKFRKEHGGG